MADRRRMYHSGVSNDQLILVAPSKSSGSDDRPRRGLRFPLLLAPGIFVLGGCDPIFDVGGAFFPSWILAAMVGLLTTVLVRAGLVRSRINDRLFGHGFAYLGLFTGVSILIWIWFFRT